MAASEECKLVLWCRELLADLVAENNSQILLFQDTQETLKWEEEGIRSNEKHFAIHGNCVKKQIEDRHIAVKYCPATEMKADVLTKSLDRTAFEHCRSKLGIVSSSKH